MVNYFSLHSLKIGGNFNCGATSVFDIQTPLLDSYEEDQSFGSYHHSSVFVYSFLKLISKHINMIYHSTDLFRNNPLDRR